MAPIDEIEHTLHNVSVKIVAHSVHPIQLNRSDLIRICTLATCNSRGESHFLSGGHLSRERCKMVVVIGGQELVKTLTLSERRHGLRPRGTGRCKQCERKGFREVRLGRFDDGRRVHASPEWNCWGCGAGNVRRYFVTCCALRVAIESSDGKLLHVMEVVWDELESMMAWLHGFRQPR
jgi:hypothetical protein